ncbi:hypothetical protein QWY93_02530 [Echinicola jeungdonensis]|uniref:DUF2029 domain-containing protein n=1 Tax=Echinicola jeungdonensis TaxID=709343 RepID=A0ABV5J3L3_9BACT|nr:hypothetical protein [Echinicola jeungdonensis]MDN3668205.1 hypothetical protein [Echinicola jeungdonensis]
MIPGKNYSFLDIILAMAFTGLGFWSFSLFQSPLNHELNPLFDANQYQKAYYYFRGDSSHYSVNFPFSVRLFVPWLAAQLPGQSMMGNFKMVNLYFGLSWIPIWFVLGQKLNLERYKIWIGWFWISFHWVGVLKANLSDPITVDVPLYTFQLLLLWLLIEKRKTIWLLLILGPIATLQKESMLAILLILTLFPGLKWLIEEKKEAFFALLGAFILSWVSLKTATLIFPQANEGKNAIINILNYTAGLFGHPDLILRWICSITLAYGGFLWAGIWNSKKLKAKYGEVIIPLVVVYVFFSLFAGGDFTRIAFLGSTFVMLFLLDALPLNFKQWVLLFIISLPAMRLTGFLPDGGAQFDQWKTWYPEFAPWNWLVIYLGYTLLLAWVSWKWFRIKNGNYSTSTSSSNA